MEFGSSVFGSLLSFGVSFFFVILKSSGGIFLLGSFLKGLLCFEDFREFFYVSKTRGRSLKYRRPLLGLQY